MAFGNQGIEIRDVAQKLEASGEVSTAHTPAGASSFSFKAVVRKENKSEQLSVFVGVDPKAQVERYDRKVKTKVNVECPNIIVQYNLHMGGAVLLDGVMRRYKVLMRSRK
ncbi:hypothetical protein HPB47_027100 [Ixodes persulcatus]|uniref:Uncharacterized protein n=1 Tax=Ixodes persulcatus TaxID=34615 RepID=A0AC60PWU9_IXOPE|nr:hypothetical protein HPB47_027100 [Ixodes persulcatus]